MMDHHLTHKKLINNSWCTSPILRMTYKRTVQNCMRKGPKDKKSAVKNRPFERPSLVNLIHVSELYEESGSEDKNIEENKKDENKKNTKESSYTNINEHKKKVQAEQLKDENP